METTKGRSDRERIEVERIYQIVKEILEIVKCKAQKLEAENAPVSEMGWWIISDEDVKAAQKALQMSIDLVDEQCGRTGCMCDLRGDECSRPYVEALHCLDTGLHVADGPPADYKKEGQDAD